MLTEMPHHASYFCSHVINWMVDPTPFEVKLDDILQEGMRFILNSPNYLFVGPKMKFWTCVT